MVTKNKQQAAEEVKQRFARLISEGIVRNVFDIENNVSDYVERNLKFIIEAGLGIERPRWGHEKCELFQSNGFTGVIERLIKHLVKKIANERAPALLKDILDNELTKCIKNGLSADMKYKFCSYYQNHLCSLLEEELKQQEDELQSKIRDALKETMMQVDVMTADHRKAFIERLDRLEQDAA